MREEKTKYYVIKENAVHGYAGAYRAAGNGKSGNQQKLFL